MSPPRTQPPIVLVHGAWGGAWIWRRVLAPLRAAGHEVHAVTLTGDGERAHLRHAGIGLALHAADVVALVDAEELDDFVLVGHSYGGMVITAAADRLLARAAGQGSESRKPRALVYVDAMVPLPGESWSSTHAPDTQAQRQATAAAHDNALPPVDPAAWGIEGADREWLLRRSVNHPFGMYREPVHFDAARWAALPRWFIDCNAPAFPTIAEPRRRVRQQPGWTVREIATGHCPMVTRPQELVGFLHEAAA
jgi:pimeloyl-ACP methyl ester carboxylesterase